MISYILPTRDRPDQLAQVLAAIGSLPTHPAELIIVDNASRIPPGAPVVLDNGIPVEIIFRPANEGAAARNHGALAADRSNGWLVMLDDDSHPADLGFLGALRDQPSDVLAVAAEIFLSHPPPSAPDQHAALIPRHYRESGGLPEVFIGCGVAIRRTAFLEADGYDPAFNYYAEEYDLSAKLLLAGGTVTLDRRFRILHHKVSVGRDMDLILRRLVRNNTWVAQRYAPAGQRRAELQEVITRYALIASKEKATLGYTAGVAEALATLPGQLRTPMPQALFDRFTGLAEARASLGAAWDERPFATAAIVDEGKNARLIGRAAGELGVRVVDDPSDADAIILGTLSPGPLLDAWERRVASADARVVTPWRSLTDMASESSGTLTAA